MKFDENFMQDSGMNEIIMKGEKIMKRRRL
jgi:hypothetical protein